AVSYIIFLFLFIPILFRDFFFLFFFLFFFRDFQNAGGVQTIAQPSPSARPARRRGRHESRFGHHPIVTPWRRRKPPPGRLQAQGRTRTSVRAALASSG